MFDYSALHWTTFLTAAVLLNLSPGPDIAFILGRTVQGGRRAGFAALAGIWTGAPIEVLAGGAGDEVRFRVTADLLTDSERHLLVDGGILPTVLRAALSTSSHEPA